MKNFVWFCIGVLTQRGMAKAWHVFYWAAILMLWFAPHPFVVVRF